MLAGSERTCQATRKENRYHKLWRLVLPKGRAGSKTGNVPGPASDRALAARRVGVSRRGKCAVGRHMDTVNHESIRRAVPRKSRNSAERPEPAADARPAFSANSATVLCILLHISPADFDEPLPAVVNDFGTGSARLLKLESNYSRVMDIRGWCHVDQLSCMLRRPWASSRRPSSTSSTRS